MKRIIALLLTGVGVATSSQAGVTFGVSAASPVYSSRYRQTPVYQPYDSHGALHRDLGEAHRDLHGDLKYQRKELERDIRQAREALHHQLKHERACGVPAWEREAKHDSAHQAFKQWRRAGEQQLREQHGAAHNGLRYEHQALRR